MHEFSLISDLMKKIESVARQQKAAKIISVKVKLGALSHISGDHFREHFVHAARGTMAADARLDIVELSDQDDPRAQEILLDSVEVAE